MIKAAKVSTLSVCSYALISKKCHHFLALKDRLKGSADELVSTRMLVIWNRIKLYLYIECMVYLLLGVLVWLTM
jgi:hypothetical protein